MRRLVTVAIAALVALTLTLPSQAQDIEVARYQGNGDVGGFFNIMPPGQKGVFNGPELLAIQGGQWPDHAIDQTEMYAGLVHAAGLPSRDQNRLGITDSDITAWFKDASFGQLGQDAVVNQPTEGLTIVRDSRFGVPHIYGETREAAMFGAGYAGAEDRLFLMDVLRHLGRGRLSEFLGASEGNKQMDRDQLKVAPYTEEELSAQVADLCAQGEEGVRICADADAYTAGVNAYMAEARRDPSKLPGEYPALQQVPEDWINEDIVAIASLVGGIFGRGGGGEVASGRFLAQLQRTYGAAEGRRIFDDFRSADDPDAPSTIPTRFEYNNHDDIDPASTAILDLETVSATASEATPGPLVADGPFGPMDLSGLRGGGMSNAIVASARASDGGTPIAVFGPQTGYFTPQLLVEMDIHGPGIDARGVSFAGTNLYVQLGRGRDYAWSATSAGGDNVDQWILELCEPSGLPPSSDSTHYRHDGECKAMDVYTHRQFAKPSAGGIPDSPSPDNIVFDIEVKRSVYGPVVATGTVDGKPVAVTEQRSTYGSELASAFGFMRINDPDYMTAGVGAFNSAFDGVDYTFNWFYVDTEDVAYKHSCKCPIRDPRSDPDLPTWGTGEWDWTGRFLAPSQQPQSVNQAFYANWNNKQAPGFRANDSNYSYSSTYRSEFLRKRMAAALASGRRLTRADMVNIAEDAGTVDLNGQEIYPLALRILDQAGVRGSQRVEQLRAKLAEWTRAGGHRRDVDADGTYDHAVAIAIGDALLRPLLDGVFGDELDGADLPERVEDHPNQGLGSAYNGGRANFLEKDFQQVLGEPLAARRSKTYCGDGTVRGCADVILAAIAEADTVLTEEYETDTIDEWVYDKSADFIIQSPVGVAAAPPMEWVNRPTFHQVVQAGSRTGRVDPGGKGPTAVALSRHAFPGGADAVVITSGSWFHALAATPLAAQEEAPLLVSGRARMGAGALREVERLGASTAYIVGATQVLDARIERQLEAAGVETIVRINRKGRAGIAAGVARRLQQPTNSVVVASAQRAGEALAAAAYAGRTNRAVLLTNRRSVPRATRRTLGRFDAAIVIGGKDTIAPRAVRAMRAAGIKRVRRLSGDNADGTHRAVLDRLHRERPANRDVYVVGRAGTALAAGAAAAARQGAVVPMRSASVTRSPLARGYLQRRAAAIHRLWILDDQRRFTSGERARLERLIAR
jgi:acyl-homoserine lactone acylase PvdQ